MSDPKGQRWLVGLEGGCKLKAYRDSGGVPTIGVGCVTWPGGRRVEIGDTLVNQAAGIEIFVRQLKEYEQIVDAYTHDAITQPQFDALCAFAYNEGKGAVKIAEFIRAINQGASERVISESWRNNWKRVGGRIDLGLIERRECEIDCYFKGIYRLQGQHAA
jgi:lysozyme